LGLQGGPPPSGSFGFSVDIASLRAESRTGSQVWESSRPRKREWDRGRTSARERTAGRAGRRIGWVPLPFNLGNHQDSCAVIGFVSQFFSSTSGALSSTSTLGRHSSCAADGRVGAQRQLPRAKAHGWIPSDLAVSCMTIRILRAKASWLTGAMGQEQQPLPGVASLASSRNFINTAKNDGERSRRQTGANLTRTGVWQVQAILGIRASAPKAGAAGRGGIVSRRLRSELGRFC
jgi:hypothetical protein